MANECRENLKQKECDHTRRLERSKLELVEVVLEVASLLCEGNQLRRRNKNQPSVKHRKEDYLGPGTAPSLSHTQTLKHTEDSPVNVVQGVMKVASYR